MWERLRESLKRRAERQHSRDFLAATMAASALVATADGDVSFSERMRLDQILEQLQRFGAFDVHTAIDRFNDVADDLRDHGDKGRRRTLEAIGKMDEDPDMARLLVRIACALSLADGRWSDSEQNVVAEICARLKIRPEDCNLEEIVRGAAAPTEPSK